MRPARVPDLPGELGRLVVPPLRPRLCSEVRGPVRAGGSTPASYPVNWPLHTGKEKVGMLVRWTRRRLMILTLTAFAIMACGDNLSTGNSTLPDGAVDDIGATARDEVEAALSALTLPGSLDPLGTAQAPTRYAPGCVTPSTPADADGDGVPDDAIYLFTAPPCRFTGWRGGTLDIVGQLRVQDPDAAHAGFGYEGTLTGLRTRFTTADNKVIYDVTRNGTRLLSGSVSSLLLSADLQVIRTFAGKPDAALDEQWTL